MTTPTIQLALLDDIYGSNQAQLLWEELRPKIEQTRLKNQSKPYKRLTQADAILICYGDQVSSQGFPPLATLADFFQRYLDGLISSLHILPFYPSSSDDGFAVIDYRKVDPLLGSWDDISRLGENFNLMFDAVINHVSSQSEWFKAFLREEPPYNDYFILVNGKPDLSQVVRPRALPLLARFGEQASAKYVWTTFSSDQIDLNYKNPRVLSEIIDLMLFYTRQGAEFIRLDAIAYLWKEPGTTCIHLPQTHRIIQFFRAVLNEAAPNTRLITETNVPHVENISYFGDGTNEAQLVYNFALPPLVLHTLQTADSSALSNWASSLRMPSSEVTFFNFLASHDGIGLNPVRGILSDEAIDTLVKNTLSHKGRVSYKQNLDGSQSPYELNINYFDALSSPDSLDPLSLQIGRFMAAQAILLSFLGLPGIYFHSLFGSRGWLDGPLQTGSNRSINRQKLSRQELETELDENGSLRQIVFQKFAKLLHARRSCAAFDPFGSQIILNCGKKIFGSLRYSSSDPGERVLCLQNVSSEPQVLGLDVHTLPGDQPERPTILNLISGEILQASPSLNLAPYQTLWLVIEK